MKQQRNGIFVNKNGRCSSCGGQNHFNLTSTHCWFCLASWSTPVPAAIVASIPAISMVQIPRPVVSTRPMRVNSSKDFLGGLAAGLAVVVLPFFAVLAVRIA